MSTLITIDLDALTANYHDCRDNVAPATCGAVVKADAYGLGITRIATALYQAGCHHFFTATHREGIALRGLLGEADVFVFEGVTAESAAAFREHDRAYTAKDHLLLRKVLDWSIEVARRFLER